MFLPKKFSVLLFLSLPFFLISARAESLSSEQEIIKGAAQEINALSLNFNNQFPTVIEKLSHARGVILCPNMNETSIFFNRFSKGQCVLLSRDSQNGWTSPAFYHLSKEDGFEISKEKKNELAFFIMTQKALEAFLDKKVILKKSTTFSILSLKENIFSSRMPDLYVVKFAHQSLQNISLGNIEISFNEGANKHYYNRPVDPMDILVSMKVNNPNADDLRRKLMYSF